MGQTIFRSGSLSNVRLGRCTVMEVQRPARPATALYGAHKAIKTSVQMYTLRMSCNTPCTSAVISPEKCSRHRTKKSVYFFRFGFQLGSRVNGIETQVGLQNASTSREKFSNCIGEKNKIFSSEGILSRAQRQDRETFLRKSSKERRS